MRKSPDATPALGRSIRRSAAIRPIPVLDVHHPLERDAEVAASRAFDAPRATSTSHAGLSPVFLDPRELPLGPGVALSPSTRKPFEQRMGQSFSGVRVHVGLEAGALAERLHARAFTHGRDIFFAQGEFRPETRSGRGLIAHELAHTLQPQARGGTAAIARFAAPGAAPPILSEEARKWLDARSCVEPTSSQALALLAAFQRLPPAVQAEILAQYKVNTAANSARLAEDLKKRAAASTQRVIGADGLSGTITGTREFVESVQSLNQTSRGTAAVASNVLGAVGLGIGMEVFDDKERQLSMGEFGAELGNILLTGPGTNKALGSRGAPRQDHAPVPQTIEIKSHVVSGVVPALTKPSQIKLGPAPGPKRVADDAGVQVRPKPATAPQATPKTALSTRNARLARRDQEVQRRFEAARAQDGIARIPSRTDREIMTLARKRHRADKKTLADARKRGESLPYSANSFLNENLTAATQKVMAKRLGDDKVRGFKSGIIGYVGERPVFGSAKHGVGVIKYGDTLFVVQMKDASAQIPRGATLVEILGKFD